jgi:hypothetical protein
VLDDAIRNREAVYGHRDARFGERFEHRRTEAARAGRFLDGHHRAAALRERDDAPGVERLREARIHHRRRDAFGV